ncbi:MAG: hypothetical protein ACPGVO_18475 [Spirulinaceae cyanobacterium]
MFDAFRLPILLVIPLASVIALGIVGLASVRAIAQPMALQNGEPTQPQSVDLAPADLTPILEEFEPDNNGSPDDSSGAGGR